MEWQRGLWRQFGRIQQFELVNQGTEKFFSDFKVVNPVSDCSYRVAIRGLRPGDNFCACPEKLLDKARTLFDEEAEWCLAPQRYGKLDNFIKAAAKYEHELRAYDDALDYVAGLRDAEKLLQLLNQTFPLGIEDPQWKKLLNVPLYPYQKEGVLFAIQAGRALIGDEMGLGKTIQAIAVTEILARYFVTLPCKNVFLN